MRLRINIAVSLLALLTIVWGVRTAAALEQRRTDAYLQAQFQSLNDKYFGGKLPPTTVRWTDMKVNFAETHSYTDGSFVVEVDRRKNFLDKDELDDTIRHETCHVATPQDEHDAHGSAFKQCMNEIK